MSSNKKFGRTKIAWVAGMLAAALLAGCGGGGGDDDDGGPPGTIDLSVANRDAVAHAAMAAVLGLGGADEALSANGAQALLQREVARAVNSLRERPLAVISFDDPCLVSGFTRTSIDDRNGNGVADLNELATVEFVQCKDSLDETANGSIGITLSQVTSSSFSGSVALDALTIVRDSGTQQHSTRLDGPMQMKVTASSDMLGTFRLTTSAPVTVTVATPVFSDTVTLHAGFLQEATVDAASAPPPGGTTPGSASTRSSGRITSQAAGGEVTVTTTVPLLQYADDAFPRSGSLDVTGRNGSIAIQPLSPDQVRIDLDANGDGAVEDTTTQRWDWLI